MSFFRKYWKSITWFGLMGYLFFMPKNKFPKDTLFHFKHADKLVHAGLFTVLVLIFSIETYRSYTKRVGIIMLLAILLTLAYGILTELIQYHFISSRSGTVADLLADLAGGIIAILFLPVILRIRFLYSYLNS